MSTSVVHDIPKNYVRLCHLKSIESFSGFGFNLHSSLEAAQLEIATTRRLQTTPLSNKKINNEGDVHSSTSKHNNSPNHRQNGMKNNPNTDHRNELFTDVMIPSHGQYVGSVDFGSPAWDGGLKPCDRIVEVNGVNVENENHQQVVSRIRLNMEETSIMVVDLETDEKLKKTSTLIRNGSGNFNVDVICMSSTLEGLPLRIDPSKEVTANCSMDRPTDQTDMKERIHNIGRMSTNGEVSTHSNQNKIDDEPNSDKKIMTKSLRWTRNTTELFTSEDTTVDQDGNESAPSEDFVQDVLQGINSQLNRNNGNADINKTIDAAKDDCFITNSGVHEDNNEQQTPNHVEPTKSSDWDGLSLHMSVKEMKEKLSKRRKKDGRKLKAGGAVSNIENGNRNDNESLHVNFDEKFKIFDSL